MADPKKPAKKAAKKAAPAKKTTAAKKSTAAKKPAAAAKKPAAPVKKATTPAKKAAAKPAAPVKKTAAKPKPAPAPVVEHEHEHEHDHDEHDHVHEEVDEEQDRVDVERMVAALAALDDDRLQHGLTHMSEKTRGELAGQLQLPRATMHLGTALIPLVRRKLHTVSKDHQLQAAFALSECANDDTIEALGERADDPTVDDLKEVLPPVVAAHGAPIVTAMLAAYAASNAPCRPAMRELLETDAQYVVGPAVSVDGGGAAIAVFKPVVDEAKREQRREAKAAKREAEARAKAARAAGEAKRREAVHKSKRKGHR